MASFLEKKKNEVSILQNKLPDLKNKVNTYFQSLDFFEQKTNKVRILLEEILQSLKN